MWYMLGRATTQSLPSFGGRSIQEEQNQLCCCRKRCLNLGDYLDYRLQQVIRYMLLIFPSRTPTQHGEDTEEHITSLGRSKERATARHSSLTPL